MPLEYALQFRGKFPDPGPWRFTPSNEVHLTQPLGIDALPNQTVIRSRRKPYVFNLMVAGESGLGKTTFINTLFDAPLKEQWERKNVTDQPTVHIQSNVYLLTEKDERGKDVSLQLTVIDTPGFGDALNRETKCVSRIWGPGPHNFRVSIDALLTWNIFLLSLTSFDPIADYINQQYVAYYNAERETAVRPEIEDTRIHCLLYFVSPNGKGSVHSRDRNKPSNRVLNYFFYIIFNLVSATLTSNSSSAWVKSPTSFPSLPRPTP